MAQWENYWKIITPASRKTAYSQPTINMDDGMNINSAGYSSFSTVAWFSNLLKGATARLQRYKQYDAMDIGDISRALDIIAEEISNPDKRTSLPFIIDYQTEENQEIPDTTVTTLRAALRHWSRFHKLNKRVYNTARQMVKYGDCFFRKTSDTEQWEYVDPTRVIGVEINAQGEKVAYHIRPSSFMDSVKAMKPGSATASASDSVEITPAIAMLHFTLSDDMSDTAPFGLSILQSAFKDYQKLTMLEDSAIIYRIVRAPERRVFYIDVGNMAPHRVKQHLETIRNDLRQKRMPNTANQNQTDSQYNAESIGEDIFLPVTAAGRSSRVETLPGGTTWEIPELDYFLNKVFRALRVPSSYMKGQDATNPGSAYNDGKTGVAYMEERIFANFVIRLQSCIQEVFDEHFKAYLKVTGINIDPDLFKLTLAEPQNFALYRQAALDTELIASFKAVEDTPYLSKRFMMERYLGLTKDDIQMNEALLKQERGIQDGLSVDEIRQFYDPNVETKKETVGPAGGEEPPEAAGAEEEPEEASPEEKAPATPAPEEA
jgi:hypothetical protein